MKKSIFTIAFASLLFVGSSFTTMQSTDQDPPIGGQCTDCTPKKKKDEPSVQIAASSEVQLSSFASDSQAIVSMKKID